MLWCWSSFCSGIKQYSISLSSIPNQNVDHRLYADDKQPYFSLATHKTELTINGSGLSPWLLYPIAWPLWHVVMPPIARGQTCLFQPLPVSTVPNTGRNLSNSDYRGLDEEDWMTAVRIKRHASKTHFLIHEAGNTFQDIYLHDFWIRVYLRQHLRHTLIIESLFI